MTDRRQLSTMGYGLGLRPCQVHRRAAAKPQSIRSRRVSADGIRLGGMNDQAVPPSIPFGIYAIYQTTN